MFTLGLQGYFTDLIVKAVALEASYPVDPDGPGLAVGRGGAHSWELVAFSTWRRSLGPPRGTMRWLLPLFRSCLRCSGNPASTLGSGGETPLETWARSTAWAATALHHCAKKLRSSLHSQHRAWFGKQIGVQGVLEPLSTWWGSSPLLLRVLSLSESNYVTRTHRTQQEQSAS